MPLLWPSLNPNVNLVNNGGAKEMAKAIKQKPKKSASAKKSSKTARDQAKAAEYVGCLIELHKLQGLLLSHLRKQL